MTEQERNELHERIAQVKERVARAAEKGRHHTGCREQDE